MAWSHAQHRAGTVTELKQQNIELWACCGYKLFDPDFMFTAGEQSAVCVHFTGTICA